MMILHLRSPSSFITASTPDVTAWALSCPRDVTANSGTAQSRDQTQAPGDGDKRTPLVEELGDDCLPAFT
jgi:hypothetical protein